MEGLTLSPGAADSTNVQIAPRAGNAGAPVGLRADMAVCSWPT